MAMPSPVRPSAVRPSIVRSLTGGAPQSPHVFEETKINNVNLAVFSSDVLMEGELEKKGEGGLQTWKTRLFSLRGQELSYYTVENDRAGAHKGTMNVRGATVDRLDGQQFAVTLKTGSTRVFIAPSVQAQMDWMTAIAVAADARIVEPASDRSLVDHSRTTHILLVRHGHYHTSQTPSQDMNGPLTELGIEQSKRTGEFLLEYLNARQVFKRFPKLPVYHSGMRRTFETAQWIARAFPDAELRENKLLREAWPSNPLPSSNRKMLPREKIDNMVSDCARLRVAYRTTFRHLIPDDLTIQECELSDADKAEFAAIFANKTQHRMGDRYRVVVCHANIIRWFVCRALGVDPDGTWGRMRYSHCGLTAMEIDSVGNVQLSFMNQTGHLATPMITEN